MDKGIKNAFILGAFLGGYGVFRQQHDLAAAFGGALGGSLLFAVIWRFFFQKFQ